MAKQNPPLFNIPPSRVVDMIPRLPPPRLEGGTWSNPLREFVALCLNEVPEERATVDELLRSKFVKASKGLPSSLMRELIMRYEAWASRGGVRDSMWQAALQSDMDQLNATLASEPGWDFDTVKSRLSGVSEYIKQEMSSGSSGSTSNVSTLKAAPAPTPTPYRSVSEAARQRAAEGLVRLFQSPEEEAATAAAAAAAAKNPGNNNLGPYESSLFRSDASSRSTTPENKVSMISIPTFDDNGLRVPEKRAASPNTSAKPAAIVVPASTPTPPPPPIVRIRRNRADSAGASVHRANLSSSPTPPTPIDDRAVSPSPSSATPTPTPTPTPRRPSAAASAPSSPPRNHYTPPQLGLKSHHLPSKSAPNIAVIRDGGPPPLPTIAPTPPPGGVGGGLRLASNASVPHGKSRSADITRGRPAGGRPGNLNLDLPAAAAAGMLPPSPGRPWGGPGGAGMGGGGGMGGAVGFPVIEPLDVGVLPLDGGDPRMWEELDRVLGGLGDALEVVQVGLKGMRRRGGEEE